MRSAPGILRTIPLTNLAILFIALVYLGSDIRYHNWTRTDPEEGRGVIHWDIISYYSYLPATFIYGDVTLGFLDDPPEGFVNDSKFWYLKLENGNRIVATSMGMAFMYAPFFFMAHGLAPLFGEARDGFGSIYQFFLVMSALFYVILGFFVLKKVLLRFFNTRTTALTLLAVALGTNLFYYATHEGPMAHATSFFLVTLYLWMVFRWFDWPNMAHTLGIGALLGLLSLVRPTNILVLLLLLLYGVTSFRELWERILFFIRRFHLVVLMFAAFLLVWAPQFIYWKVVTGQFVFNSYGPFGGRFFFDYPHILENLIGYKKGFFIYVPLMFFAVLGIGLLRRRIPGLFWPVLVLMFVMIYVQSSWWSWWFGGGFGMRCYIDIYGVLAIPLAATVAWAFERRHLFFRMAYPIMVVALILFHQFNTWQYKMNIIHYNGMNREAYWDSFLKFKRPPDYWVSLTLPDYTLARMGIYVFYHTGADHSDLKEMGRESGLKELERRVRSDRKLLREVRRYAEREEVPMEEALSTVTSRMYERMAEQ